MSIKPSSNAPPGSTALVEKSDLVSQTSHGPTLNGVAALLLQQALEKHYPQLHIDPDKAFVGTPQWQVAEDDVQAGPITYEPLTVVLLRQSLEGGIADYFPGEHFLTLEPDAIEPVHLAVDIERIAEMLNDGAARLFIEMQKYQLQFWNEQGQTLPRWQELSSALQKAVNITAMKGLDDDECAMAREVFTYPDKTDRDNSTSHLTDIHASLIDIDTVENEVATHLVLGGALVLQAKVEKRELLVMYTIERGFESFSSLQQLGDSLPASLEELLVGRDMTWRLYQPEGNIFDHMACALVNSQLDVIGAMRSLQAPQWSDEPPPDEIDTTDATQQLEAAVPQWLRQASGAELQDYSRYITGLGKLYRDPERHKTRNAIPAINVYAQRQMSAAIIADSSAVAAADLPLDQLRINITNSFTAGNFTLPNPLDHRVVNLAEFALENAVPYQAKVSFVTDTKVPAWLTPAFLSRIAAEVDIGQAYPALIKKQLIDDAVQAQRQKIFYGEQLRWLLPLLALECKVRHSGGVDERGYRYVCDLLSQDAAKRQAMVICPLTLTPQHRVISSSDTVSNMFIIHSRQAPDGVCVLYRPMMDQALMQFPSPQNLLYAMHQPGELRDSVLAWLPDKTLSFEYAQYVFPVGIPSPWLVAEQLVNPTLRAENLGEVVIEQDAISDDLLAALFSYNAQAMAELADRESQSNAERRWTLLKDSGEALLAVASNFLSGSVGAAVWVWQTIDQLQQALDARERKDSFSEWTAASDILLTLGILLSHRAVQRNRTLSAKPPLKRSLPKKPAVHRDVITTFDTEAVTSALSSEHLSSLDSVGVLPRRTPSALGMYLDTFKVPALDLQDKDVTQVGVQPPYLYHANEKSYAKVGERWFRVLETYQGDVRIVAADDITKTGPMLTHNQKGQWFVDLRLRLRGGGGNALSKIALDPKELRFNRLDDALRYFKSQETTRQAQLRTRQIALNELPQQDFAKESNVYADELAVSIKEYRQALEQLREWRTLGGKENYREDLLRMTTTQALNVAQWLIIKQSQYAAAITVILNEHETQLSREVFVSNIQDACDLSRDMADKLTLANTTLNDLQATGKVGVQKLLDIRARLPTFTVLELKANEIGLSAELCLQNVAEPLLSQLHDRLGRVGIRAAIAARGALEMIHVSGPQSLTPAHIEGLSNLLDTFADANQRLRELGQTYSEQLEEEPMTHLQDLIGEFIQLTEARTLELLAEVQADNARQGTSRERNLSGSSRATVKVRKSRPRDATSAEPAGARELPLTPFTPVIPSPAPAAPRLKDLEIINEALDLNIDADDFIERSRKDALRPRRLASEMQDVFDQQALKLGQCADNVDQALQRIKDAKGDVPPVSKLSQELRVAAVKTRNQGLSTRTALYKLRKPTQSAFKWLSENARIDIRRDERGRIQTKGLGDYFQEYRIFDKFNKDTPMWVAHFHYERATSPTDEPTAAHLKVADDYLTTLTAPQKQALTAFEPIDGVLRKITDPALRQLFLTLEPKSPR
jgi:hypothetical protein